MTTWFEGSHAIGRTLDQVEASLADDALHHVGVVRHMPGLTRVELSDHEPGSITIETNEGVMTRSHLTTHREGAVLVTEYDEEYRTSKLTVTSHHRHEFTSTAGGVTQRTVLSDVQAPGLIGASYRRLGRANIGNAILDAYDAFLTG